MVNWQTNNKLHPRKRERARLKRMKKGKVNEEKEKFGMNDCLFVCLIVLEAAKHSWHDYRDVMIQS